MGAACADDLLHRRAGIGIDSTVSAMRTVRVPRGVAETGRADYDFCGNVGEAELATIHLPRGCPSPTRASMANIDQVVPDVYG
jgi:hypothetical protein